MSAFGVDWVAATAAGSTGLRGGGAAFCRGAMAGGGSAAGVMATGFSVSLVVAVRAFGAAPRAIGRGFGIGTGDLGDAGVDLAAAGLARAAVASPDNPTSKAQPAVITDASTSNTALDRHAEVRAKAVTTVLRSESIDRVRI